jgi:hypothetical protein
MRRGSAKLLRQTELRRIYCGFLTGDPRSGAGRRPRFAYFGAERGKSPFRGTAEPLSSNNIDIRELDVWAAETDSRVGVKGGS